MARIGGVDLPNEKRVEIGLTYIYGIGRHTSNIILKETDELKRESWLYLTKIVYEVNKILLNILAIELPDRM